MQESTWRLEATDRDPTVSAIVSQRVTDWIDDQIVALPGLERRVATLRWILGRTTDETATEIGVATGTVKSALHRARRKLSQAWRELTGGRSTFAVDHITSTQTGIGLDQDRSMRA
jgi:DNA-directed RNA polymerase specialized sigma24 family protein